MSLETVVAAREGVLLVRNDHDSPHVFHGPNGGANRPPAYGRSVLSDLWGRCSEPALSPDDNLLPEHIS
jgi:hypothetical protein